MTSMNAAASDGGDAVYRSTSDAHLDQAGHEAALLQAAVAVNQQIQQAPRWDEAAAAVLARVGEALGGDRAYMCRHHCHPQTGAEALSAVLQWRRSHLPETGTASCWQNRGYADAGLTDWLTAFLRGAAVMARLAELPLPAQAWLAPDGIEALLLLPIWAEGQLWGCLGVAAIADRTWSVAERSLLQLAADSLGAAISRSSDQWLQASRLIDCPEAQHAVQTDVQASDAQPGATPTEAQLSRIQAILQAQQDVIPDGILVLDEHQRVISYNQPFCDLWQLAPETVEGGEGQVILQAMQRRLAWPDTLATAAALDQQPDRSSQREISLTDGRMVEICFAPVRSRRGDPLGRIWYCRDISDRKQAEVQAQQSDALLNSVINGTDDLMFVKDLQGRYLLANAAIGRVFGKSPESLQGQDDSALYDPDVAASIQAVDQALLLQGKSQTFEQQVPIEGQMRTFLISKTPYRDPEGTIIGLIGISRDITELRQAQVERDRFFRLTSDMMGIAGFDGYLKRINPAFTRILGHSEAELLATPMLALIHPDDRPASRRVAARLARGESIHSFENRWRCRDGSYRWFSWSSTPYGADQVIYATARDITDRKRTEAALQYSEQRFRDVTEAAGEYVWEIDADGVYTFLTDRVEAVKGHPREQLLGRSPFSVMYGDDVASVQAVLRSASAQKTSFKLEHRDVTPSGTVVWEEVSGLPRLDEAGQVIGFRGTGLSITEQKQAEAALIRFKQAVESSSDAICITDTDLEHVYQNRAFSTLLGYEDVDTFRRQAGNILQTYADPETAKRVLNQIRQFGQYSGEVTLRSRQGRHIPVLLRANTIQDEAGNLTGTIRAYTDISDRKAAEAQMQVQAQFLRSIYDGVEHRIFVFSVQADGEIVCSSYNRAAAAALGQPSDQVAGRSPEAVFGEESGRAIRAICQRCASTGTAITQEDRLMLSGDRIWMLTTFYPLRDAAGQVHRVVATSFDITSLKQAQRQLKQQAKELQATLQELRRAQAQLVQSEKMSSLGQLVAGVAHEINNPVNFIYGNLTYAREYTEDLLELIQLYQRHYGEPPEEIQRAAATLDLDFVLEDLPKLLNSMKVGAERIQAIVSSLRIFSRMDEADCKVVDLRAGIESTLMILQNRLKARAGLPEIVVIQDYQDLPQVECYAGQLNQVFMNILSNAVDALEAVRTGQIARSQPPTIRIHTALTPDQQVMIQISDNGPGIDPSVQARLFDPFFTTKPIGKGTGMGLSISYQIVTEKHGGTLTCDSTPGEGTTFRITIPLEQPH